MAIQDLTLEQQAADCFAEAIRNEPVVKRLWVWSQNGYLDPGQDFVELWMLTDEIDEATKTRLFAADKVLNDRFPGVEFRVWLISPGYYDPNDPMSAMRSGMREVPLVPA